jgi:signal transduction histidine kinase
VRRVRVRATAIVTLVVAVSLLAGGAVLVTVLRTNLTDNLDATLQSLVTDRATLVEQGSDPTAVTDTSLREAIVWIGTADGRALASGGRISTEGPPAGVDPGVRTVTTTFTENESDGTSVETERLRIAVARVTAPVHGDVVVAVGAELEVVDQPVADVRRLLLAGSPFLLTLVAALTWFTADRALRPVERIRRSAERISDHGDGATVDVPSTGDEIERLAHTVNQMLARLADRDERQREFVGNASHELKSPLANLRIDLETATDVDAVTRSRQITQVDRLAAIVDDLLALARNDEHHPMPAVPVDLDDVVFDALEAAASSHDLAVDIDGVVPVRVSGDADQLARAVRNLVDNATRHAVSRVALSIETSEGHAVVHVDDDGDGVPDEHRARIFERFARVDAARGRADGGTGLGLPIVVQIARRHGGSTMITDSPLGGARFSLSLPLTAT